MKQINYENSPSKTLTIMGVLTGLGIRYKSKYKPNRVPCQTAVMLIIQPKSVLEYYAALGVINA